jgi:hypothetical protein
MGLSFYMAAGFDTRDLMRERRAQLQAMGHRVTSRWIDETEPIGPASEAAEHSGNKDLEDIDRAWQFLLFTESPSTTGGYHVEFGYALAQGKMLVVIGPYTNIFQRQAMYQFNTWNDFLKGWGEKL